MARKNQRSTAVSPSDEARLDDLRFIVDSTRQGLRRFRRHLRSCLRKQDGNSVHDLRVAARRLMVWCDWLDRLQAGDSVTETRRRVKRLLRALSALRDLQVQLELLRKMPRTATVSVRFCRRWLRPELEREKKRVGNRCRRVNLKKIASGLKDGVKSLKKRGSRSQRAHAGDSEARRWVKVLVARADRDRGKVDAANPATLHRLRVGLKHLRYALELFQTSRGNWPQSRLRRLKVLLDLLGEIQDADIFQVRLKDAMKASPAHIRPLQIVERWLIRRRESRIRRFMRYSEALGSLLKACEFECCGV